MVTEVRWRLLKIAIVVFEITLLIYVTLDAIYIHTWFNTENESVVIVPIVQMLIVIAGIFCFQCIKQKERD